MHNFKVNHLHCASALGGSPNLHLQLQPNLYRREIKCSILKRDEKFDQELEVPDAEEGIEAGPDRFA